MTYVYLLLALYSAIVMAGSLFGGWLPRKMNLSHTGMQVILSFVGGLMLGIGLLHMLPHSIVLSRSIDVGFQSALVGLLSMFFLIRLFHFHQHGPVSEGPQEGHDHCEHDHSHGHHHDHGPVHGLSWAGVATGMTLHTLIDGVALGAAVAAGNVQSPTFQPWGFGVFLAIALHQPLDALSITMLMEASGWSRRAQTIMNVVFALMCPIGAFLFVLGLGSLGSVSSTGLGMALGFSAGTFLCISLSDLLPEVQFHRHDKLKLSAALIAGLAAAYGIGLLEGGAVHELPPSNGSAVTEVVPETGP
ncbi:MAG: ZIP family metal transporter [Planctomycetota bacterium]